MESNKFRISLDDLNSQIEAGELKELNLIIKADVQGCLLYTSDFARLASQGVFLGQLKK